MPSQTLSSDDIRRRYGNIDDFVAPYPDHPVSHGLPAGAVTDDTEQALLLARRLIASAPGFDTRAWVADLLAWERDVRSRGLRDLLGPSSKRALEAIAAGADPDVAGREGTTNGAAMRIAPVGIAVACSDVPAFVDHVEAACRATHGTGEAIAAASAVAAAISAGIDGASFDEAVPVALAAAAEGQRRGNPIGEADMAGRIGLALAVGASGDATAVSAAVGTSVASRESVAAAFGIVRVAKGDVWRAAMLAANIGDDTDTIGAIACAMAGATGGAGAVPADRVALVRRVNSLPIEELAAGLLRMRAGT